jgi:hypothetical protein
MFKGGLEKSKQLPPLYEAVAKMGGAEFLNAGSDVSTDGVDGLHLHVRIREKAEATRGFDGHKRGKGRKRHLLVDTLGDGGGPSGRSRQCVGPTRGGAAACRLYNPASRGSEW